MGNLLYTSISSEISEYTDKHVIVARQVDIGDVIYKDFGDKPINELQLFQDCHREAMVYSCRGMQQYQVGVTAFSSYRVKIV